MNTLKLNTALRRAGRYKRAADTAAATCAALAVLIAAALSAILLDAAFGFGAAVLTFIDALLLTLLLAVVFYVCRAFARNRFEPRRTARLVEQTLNLHDNRFILAVELSADAAPAGSAALRDMTISEAQQRAREIAPSRVIDRRRLKRSVWAACGAAMFALVLLLAAPRLFAMVVPRYLDPAADLPPYTLVRFDVTVEPQKVYFGRPLVIRATMTGPIHVDQADVVFVDGRAQSRAPMMRTEAGIFVLPVERADRSRRFYIDTPSGRSDIFNFAVLPTPVFEKVSVRYDYPAYTVWPTIERPLDETGIRALIGTRITLTAHANLPLREGRLIITDEMEAGQESLLTLAPADADPAVVSGSFEVQRNGHFSLSLIGVDDSPSDNNPSGPIIAVPDAPPQVQISEPELRIIAPEGWKIPLSATANDDVAIDRLVLSHRIDDQVAVDQPLPIQRRGPMNASTSTTLDLAAIGATIGQSVRGFVTAYDNHPDPPQSADSATFEIAVVSRAEYDELARQQYHLQQIIEEIERYRRQLDQIAEQRKKLIEQLEQLKASPEPDSEAMERALKAMQEYARQSQALADRLKERSEAEPLWEFEQPYQDQLRQLAQQLQQQADATAANQQKLASEGPSPEAIDQALEQLKADQRIDESTDPQPILTQEQFEQLQLADRMMAETDVIMEIARRQRQLADHLSNYEGRRPSELSAGEIARLSRLGEEQAELKRQLTESLERLKTAADEGREKLPRMGQSADELIASIRDLKIEQDQQAAVDAARLAQGATTYHRADAAATKLESLISECQSMGQCASDDLDGILSLTRSQLANALNQLSQSRKMGRGTGSGAGAGSGISAGSAFAGPGGYSGGAAPMTLVGPRMPAGRSLRDAPTTDADDRAPSFGRAGDGRSQWFNAAGVETLTPDSRDSQTRAADQMSGVPTQYQALAEQYFRRLAEDAAKPAPPR